MTEVTKPSPFAQAKLAAAPETKSPAQDKGDTNQDETESPAADDKVRYACPSIARLRIGKFQFENGNLELTAEEAERFDSLLEGASPRTKQAVHKIADRAAADAVARRFLEQRGSMIRGGDTTANSAAAANPSDPQNAA